MKKCLFYGSLKRGKYNYQRFPGQEFVQNVQLPGYDLYNLGPYPAACAGDGVLQAELHEIPLAVFNLIHRMEIGAGYYEAEVKVNDEPVSIFLMPANRLKKSEKINSGAW